jgi:hypothetical protein
VKRGAWRIGFGLGILFLASRFFIMRTKNDDVVLSRTPEVLTLRAAVSGAWLAQGLEPPIITSSFRDGDTGAHGRNQAEDYRTFDISSDQRFLVAADASRRAGWLYQFILEDGTQRWYYRNGIFEGFRNDLPYIPKHLHGEYDGGTT